MKTLIEEIVGRLRAASDDAGYVRPTQATGGVVDAVRALAPFELVQGDAIHRSNPGSQQVCNSNLAWVVSSGERSAHKLRKHLEALNNFAAALQTPPGGVEGGGA